MCRVHVMQSSHWMRTITENLRLFAFSEFQYCFVISLYLSTSLSPHWTIVFESQLLYLNIRICVCVCVWLCVRECVNNRRDKDWRNINYEINWIVSFFFVEWKIRSEVGMQRVSIQSNGTLENEIKCKKWNSFCIILSIVCLTSFLSLFMPDPHLHLKKYGTHICGNKLRTDLSQKKNFFFCDVACCWEFTWIDNHSSVFFSCHQSVAQIRSKFFFTWW